VRGTHKIHENWATTKSNDSTSRCCIKIGIVLVLHFNPGSRPLPVDCKSPRVSTSPVGTYIGTYLKIRIWIKLSRKQSIYPFISKRRIISLMYSSILRRIWLNFIQQYLGFFLGSFTVFTISFFGFQTFSAWIPLKRLK
jgi:hypothetical protein